MFIVPFFAFPPCSFSWPPRLRPAGGTRAPQAAAVIAGAGLTARVHLSLSVTGLQNLDVGSLSDPFVVSGSFVPFDLRVTER